MIRFVDIREAETGWRFAWWNTILDKFETHGGQQAWDTWEEFAAFCDAENPKRYRRLCPLWAFEATP